MIGLGLDFEEPRDVDGGRHEEDCDDVIPGAPAESLRVRVNDAQVTLQGYRDASISGSCFDKVNVNHISLLSCALLLC